jgi:hypothetical protein
MRGHGTLPRAQEHSRQPHRTCCFQLFALSFAGLFIGHALVTGGAADRRFVASYTTLSWTLPCLNNSSSQCDALQDVKRNDLPVLALV